MTKKINLNLSKSNLDNYSWKSKYNLFNKEDSSLLFYDEINIIRYIERFFALHGLLIYDCRCERSFKQLDIVINYYSQLKVSQFVKIREINNYSNNTLSLKDFINLKKKEKFKNYNPKSKKSDLKFSKTRKSFVEQLQESLYLYTNKQLIINLILTNVNRSMSFDNFKYSETMVIKKLLIRLRKYRSYKNINMREFINVFLIILRKKNSANFLANFLASQLRLFKRHNQLFNFVKYSLTLFIESSISRLKGIQIVIKGRLNRKMRAKKTIIRIGQVPIQTLNNNMDYGQSVSYTPYGTFGIKVWVN